MITVAPPFGAGDARRRPPDGGGGRARHGGSGSGGPRQREAIPRCAGVQPGQCCLTRGLARAGPGRGRRQPRGGAGLAGAVRGHFLNASREYERIEQLRRSGYGSEQSFDLRRTRATRRSARWIGRAPLYRAMPGEGGAQPDIVVAARALDAAKADQERAAADLEKAYARAPVAATVLTIHAQPGERPGTKGVMTIGAIDRMKVEVENLSGADRARRRRRAGGGDGRGSWGSVERDRTAGRPGGGAPDDRGRRACREHRRTGREGDRRPRSGLFRPRRRFSNLQVTARISTVPSS